MAVYPRYLPEIEQIPSPLLLPQTPMVLPKQGSPVATIHRRMLLILGLVLLVVVPLLLRIHPGRGMALAVSQPAVAAVSQGPVVEGAAPQAAAAPELAAVPVQAGPAAGRISPVFTPEVRYWENEIVAWSQQVGVAPDLAAIIMQIESCGDPQAISRAGAQGLFQVMPFHFAAGEDSLNPDTNARRGLNYFVERLSQTNGDIGRAFAGYNGGQRAAASSWDHWPAETQRYYRWSTGIYKDIQDGLTESPTLKEWLAAGGASLCRQAATRQGLGS